MIFLQGHWENCDMWDEDVPPICSCGGKTHATGSRPSWKRRKATYEWLNTIRNGLDSGFSTDEIAAEVGSQHDSVLTRLRRMNATDLRLRLINLRAEEAERFRSHRERCVHGYFSQNADVCQHDPWRWNFGERVPL